MYLRLGGRAAECPWKNACFDMFWLPFHGHKLDGWTRSDSTRHVVTRVSWVWGIRSTLAKILDMHIVTYTGWWFGTFFFPIVFIFPYIGNVIIPTDFHLLQRGSNHQPGYIYAHICTISGSATHLFFPSMAGTWNLKKWGPLRRRPSWSVVWKINPNQGVAPYH